MVGNKHFNNCVQTYQISQFNHKYLANKISLISYAGIVTQKCYKTLDIPMLMSWGIYVIIYMQAKFYKIINCEI